MFIERIHGKGRVSGVPGWFSWLSDLLDFSSSHNPKVIGMHSLLGILSLSLSLSLPLLSPDHVLSFYLKEKKKKKMKEKSLRDTWILE